MCSLTLPRIFVDLHIWENMPYSREATNARIDRLNETIRRSFLTGIALTIPLIVTLLIIGFVLRTVTNAIEPVVKGMDLLFGVGAAPRFILEVFTLVLLFWFFLAIGFVAERRGDRESRLARTFNEFISKIPGIGSVYMGVKQMSEIVLSSDSESFRAVKLVEFPYSGTFMLCFVTATPPSTITETVAQLEMQTVFIPLAPNPVMGGFLTFVPTDRIYDIDMTVEQGMQAIMTSGVAIDPRTEEATPPEEIGRAFDEDLFDSKT